MRKLSVILGLFFLFFLASPAFAAGNIERVGVISDSILLKTTPYNAYFKTPDFLVQDIIDNLNGSKNIQVVPYTKVQSALTESRITEKQLANLKEIQQGYDLDFVFLKKVANSIGVSKLVIVTSGIDIQRDFLKPTLWNSLNVPGFDVVNPTHRITIYAALVDCNKERVLWEELYAKNIRNNKMKNLDTTISQNYEGLMRVKQYSKYVSPEISNAVVAQIAPKSVVEKMYNNGFEEFVMFTNKKMRLGSVKNLSNTEYIADAFDRAETKRIAFKEAMAEKRAANKEAREQAKLVREEERVKRAEEKAQREAQRMEEKMQQAQQKEAEKLFKQEQKIINVNFFKKSVQENEVIQYKIEPVQQVETVEPAEFAEPINLKLMDKKSIEPQWFAF